MDCTIYVTKTKALVSCALTVRLICAFIFEYAKSRLSHGAAQTIDTSEFHGIVAIFHLRDMYTNTSKLVIL